ncbi:hypothetical protein PFLU4_58320 [Pseudomonas fluorescens]|nr:hypothetical protein PFLU4_58320 [Pseudomonas fluorescens]
MANMLEHANADHFVETTVLGQVAVVQQLQLDQILQALCLDPFPSQCQLRLAQGNPEDFGTELARSVTGQAAPPTSDIQQVVTRL